MECSENPHFGRASPGGSREITPVHSGGPSPDRFVRASPSASPSSGGSNGRSNAPRRRSPVLSPGEMSLTPSPPGYM